MRKSNIPSSADDWHSEYECLVTVLLLAFKDIVLTSTNQQKVSLQNDIKLQHYCLNKWIPLEVHEEAVRTLQKLVEKVHKEIMV